jgi:hypothetical protein
MAKLAIGTVTYRIYLRIENDDADALAMREVLNKNFVKAIEDDIDFPVNRSVWEWRGDRIDKDFINSIAYGENSEERTVRQIASEHRGKLYNPEKDNPSQ